MCTVTLLLHVALLQWRNGHCTKTGVQSMVSNWTFVRQRVLIIVLYASRFTQAAITTGVVCFCIFHFTSENQVANMLFMNN